jgi:hypothetical protein
MGLMLPSTDQLLSWLVPLLMSILLSAIFAMLYVAFGEAHSNRRSFARNFVLLCMITTAIIMVIKQSIALSLGLVGALSIVRFRVAIKDPEELTFLFLMIAIGIGCGAGETGLTVTFALIAMALLLARALLSRRGGAARNSFNIGITSRRAKAEGPSSLSAGLKTWCSRVALKRFDESADTLDALFYGEFRDEAALNSWRAELMTFDKDARVCFMDPEGLV